MPGEEAAPAPAGTTPSEEGVSASVGSGAAFDVRVISEYDGTTDVTEWWTRTELLCKHRGVSLCSVLPLRLTGGAFAVWAQLPAADRSEKEKVKGGLVCGVRPG